MVRYHVSPLQKTSLLLSAILQESNLSPNFIDKETDSES
jgi:hypothetical protein